MKHLFKKLAAMTCALLAAAATTACDSSDNDGMTLAFDYMQIDFTYDVSDDLLDVADITLTYTDPADGSQQTVTLTDDDLDLTFRVKTFPATFTISAAVVLKAGITLDSAPYDLSRAVTTQFRAYYNDGDVHWSQGPNTDRDAVTVNLQQGNPDAVSDGVNAFIQALAQTYTYTIIQQSDGSFTVQTL